MGLSGAQPVCLLEQLYKPKLQKKNVWIFFIKHSRSLETISYPFPSIIQQHRSTYTKYKRSTPAEETKAILKWQELPDYIRLRFIQHRTLPAAVTARWFNISKDGKKGLQGSLPASGMQHVLLVPGNPTDVFSRLKDLPGCHTLYLMQFCYDERKKTSNKIPLC